MKKKIFSFILGVVAGLLIAGAMVYYLMDTGATVVIKNKAGQVSVIEVNEYEAYDNCIIAWVDKNAWVAR